jgi:hypothetical protein
MEQIITSAGSPSRPKFIMIVREVSAPHIGEVYGSRSFISGDLLGKRTADPERSSPTCHAPIDAVPAKDVPFWDIIDTSLPLGELSLKKTLILGPPMGIPSLNVYRRISAQDTHITTLDSSNCASRQGTQCATVKTEGWGYYRC